MRITSAMNTAITGATPKIIETAKGFLINTQYYTKEKLSAVPLEFFRSDGSVNALSIRKQLFLQNQSSSNPWRSFNDEVDIYRDSTYENRFYVRVISGFLDTSTVNTYLLTIEESPDKEFRCLNSTKFDNMIIKGIVDQDDNYLYINTLGSSTVGIYTLSKSNFTLTSRWSLTLSARNYAELTKLYSDDNNIYYMYFHSNNIYTSVFNKSTLTNTTSKGIYRGKVETPTDTILTVTNDTPYQVDENIYGLFMFNSDDPVQPIDFYYYDKNKSLTDGFDMEPVNITWNDSKSQIDFLTGTLTCTIRMFISEFDGVKYLNVASYRSSFGAVDYVPIQGIYTFRIDSKNELTFVGFAPVDRTKQFCGFIYDESKEHLIVSKQNAFQILKFNKNTLTYESTSLEVPSCYSVGLDELQRIWYIKTDSSTHMINLEDAQSVDIRFEKQYYEFTGTSIDTYITFSAVNYMGEAFNGKFELTVNGPAVFTDDGSTVTTIDYKGETKQIGLTILGASPITIYPKFIKTI